MERTTALWAVYGHFWQRNSRQGFEFNHSIKSVCVTLDAPLFDCYFELRCSVYVFDAVSFVFNAQNQRWIDAQIEIDAVFFSLTSPMLGPQLNKFSLILLVLDQLDNILRRMLSVYTGMIHRKIPSLHLNHVANGLERLLNRLICSDLVLPVVVFVSFLALCSRKFNPFNSCYFWAIKL